ncbi:alpha-L-arabinofuranosidase C-terminal domain-containing protein [Marinoscillum sp. MHG1-6]|uniref:alpha-L-arabinofuranosidase C-terminal domain-containing protein n=1 Tax=Marinoscillum sp. MHG1-6 TaxID=2959627 RepID=UPI0021571E35|nr:alpha-L-arabinofuranosidase C-terminal domain-containing protein [Marinoscillum sp. MHG1-6]
MIKLFINSFVAVSATLFFVSCNEPAQVTLKVNPETTGIPMSPTLIGAFFEDINYAADGGLYAELVQNRSFEYHEVDEYVKLKPLEAWELEGNNGSMTIEGDNPLNANNPNYLHLNITEDQPTGFRNTGFDGISVNSGEEYLVSMYVRANKKFEGSVRVALVNSKNKTIASLDFDGIDDTWSKLGGILKPSETELKSNLVITTSSKGDLYFDMISLFPKNTFKGRENGLRQDLAQTIADLNPQFVRFPGGCISHGASLDNAYRWKETVGSVEERIPNWNAWGYHQTYGLGFFEYFQFCEDIGAIPLPVVPVGISCQFRDREIAPIEDMQLWVDDALDLVEFANGAVDTEWGKVRADMGHPEPFNMEYLCLGNEEDFIPEFEVRMKMITDSLRKYYPEIKVIGTSGVAASGYHYDRLWEYSVKENLDAVDEHYYVSPSWMLNNQDRYDDFDRNGPKVFVGEYASRDDRLKNAIAEAAYLTGVEKNADVIQFTCYAPLLSNENHHQWNPDLIRFDNNNVVRTVSYYVQQLYGVYTGNEYVPSTLEYVGNFNPHSNLYTGQVGLGSWGTTVVYDDIQVVSDGNLIIEENFEAGTKAWEVQSGSFEVVDGAYYQTSMNEPSLSIYNLPVTAESYTYTLKAMKTGGREGFVIPFAYQDSLNFYWLNIGGWNNTRHAIELADNSSKSEFMSKQGSIENNKWYTIKIEVTTDLAKCYLDDELLFEILPPAKPVSASVVKNDKNNELILKLVNAGDQSIRANVEIEGIDASLKADVITLTGNDPELRNSLEAPELLSPDTTSISVGDLKNYELPAQSFKVVSIKQ